MMIRTVRDLVWGPLLLVLLAGIGILFTFDSRGFQIRGLPLWWRMTIGSLWCKREKGEKKQTSSRQAVTAVQSACTALAATIGTGNIVGVATALTAGGPGAIFWMWISALLGMMTAYGEVWLGIYHRYRNFEGKWICGPVVYLSRGLKLPILGGIYGVLCLLASLGMGSMVQSNSIAQTLSFSAEVPPLGCAVGLTGLTCLVVLGGIQRIAAVTERLIPWAAGIYLMFSAVVLFRYRYQIPGAFQEILRYAVLPEAVLGGTAGYGISYGFRYGVSRGVFSNEAGLGSLAGLHGATEDAVPEEQGMWAMFEVFFDTIIICTMTALVILLTVGGAEGLASGKIDGAMLTAWCFRTFFGKWGEYLVSGAMVVFAFATMIAWYFLGRQTLDSVLELAAEYFPGSVRWRKRIYGGYLVLYGYAVFLGSVSSLTVVWELSDIWNGLMAFPNIMALVFLRKIIRYPKEYHDC